MVVSLYVWQPHYIQCKYTIRWITLDAIVKVARFHFLFLACFVCFCWCCCCLFFTHSLLVYYSVYIITFSSFLLICYFISIVCAAFFSFKSTTSKHTSWFFFLFQVRESQAIQQSVNVLHIQKCYELKMFMAAWNIFILIITIAQVSSCIEKKLSNMTWMRRQFNVLRLIRGQFPRQVNFWLKGTDIMPLSLVFKFLTYKMDELECQLKRFWRV